MAILRVRDENGNVIDIPAIIGPRGMQGIQGVQGIQGNPGKDGLTTSVNGISQVGGNIMLGASDVGAEPATTKTEISGTVNVTIADNTEYTFTDVTGLTMTGNTNEAHGFVTFGSSAPSVSVTGFNKSGGDDVAEAKASEIWEFSCDNGYIIWKNWSA